MSNSTTMTIKIDKVIKAQAQVLADSMSLPISTIITAGLRDFIRTRSITISEASRLKPEVERLLLKVSADAKAGKNVSPAFDNLDDAFIWLDSDDN